MADDFVTISRAELDELRARASDPNSTRGDSVEPGLSRSEFAEAIEARDSAHARERDAQEAKSVELERAYKAALRDRDLAKALVGKPLVTGAATQLITLWRDDFEVVERDGEMKILAKDGRGVAQAVADRLTSSEFAHFCLPSSRGGTGSRGQNRSASPGPTPVGPKNLGEAILNQWREAVSRPQASLTPAGWGRRR